MAIEGMATDALLAITGAGIAGITASVFMNFMSQRNQNQIMSQGMQAIVGTNTMETVDTSMDDRDDK